MAGKIFINYRRGNATAPELNLGAAQALNVAQYLETRFGKSRIFIDIDRLRAGQKFPAVLEGKLADCAVMLAIIGPGWLEATDAETGARRLDNPEDWVRLEIERALALGVPVIPVLVGGMALPKKADLPPSLQPLTDHHTASISHAGFAHEMAGLAGDIQALLGKPPWGRIAASLAGLATTAFVVALLLYGPFRVPSTATAPLHDILSDEEMGLSQRAAAIPVAKTQGDITREADAGNTAETNAADIATANRDAIALLEPGSGQSARDCWQDDGAKVCGPEMVVVPLGQYTMGSNKEDDEKPNHDVTIAKPFVVGKFSVTFDEWDACVDHGGCKAKPKDEGWGRGTRPVIHISWDDVTSQYLPWLSAKTGKTYRLLTEAEWEYAVRAGTKTLYSFGDNEADLGTYAWFAANSGNKTHPVGEKKPNPWGLYDMHGNVWQWVQDCWHESYRSAPDNGSAWTRSCTDGGRRVVRGGSWYYVPRALRSAYRYGFNSGNRTFHFGFRVARTLTP